jgi:hypothetical protein
MTVLVLAPDGPMLFECDEHAVAYLEPIDVQNGEYQAFDCDGKIRPLLVTTSTQQRPFGLRDLVVEAVRIGEPEAEGTRSHQASEAIAQYLSRVHGLVAQTPSFAHLVDLLRKADGFTR